MDWGLLITFATTFASILALPGPNAAFAVGQSLRYGTRKSLAVAVGFMLTTCVHGIEGKCGHGCLSGNDREQNDDKRNGRFTDKSESTVGESIDLPSLHHVFGRLFLARGGIGGRRNGDFLFHIRDVHSWSFQAGQAFEGEQMDQ